MPDIHENTAETAKAKPLIITMSHAQPVEINRAEWPFIACAKEWDNTHESQANQTWTCKVRAHADGRAIVYGAKNTRWQGESDCREGYLIDAKDGKLDMPAIVAAIADVVEGIGASDDLRMRCVGDLPAVKL